MNNPYREPCCVDKAKCVKDESIIFPLVLIVFLSAMVVWMIHPSKEIELQIVYREPPCLESVSLLSRDHRREIACDAHASVSIQESPMGTLVVCRCPTR